MKQNEIKWEILEDGTVSVTTDDLAGSNHVSADELLKMLSGMLGGEVTSKRRNRVMVAGNLAGKLAEHTHDGHAH